MIKSLATIPMITSLPDGKTFRRLSVVRLIRRAMTGFRGRLLVFFGANMLVGVGSVGFLWSVTKLLKVDVGVLDKLTPALGMSDICLSRIESFSSSSEPSSSIKLFSWFSVAFDREMLS